jgi:hypothetical protein
MRIISTPSLKTALAFGWRNLGNVLAENALFYLALFTGCVMLSAWAATGGIYRTSSFEFTAGIAALGAATRSADPTFRMNSRVAADVIKIYILVVGSIFITLAIPFTLARLVHDSWPRMLIFLEAPVVIWAGVKLTAAPAFYTLRFHEGTTVLQALRESWFFVSDANWARVMGCQMIASLVFGFIPGLIAAFVTGLWATSHTVQAAAIASACVSLGAIPACAFSTSAVVALASTTLPPGDR